MNDRAILNIGTRANPDLVNIPAHSAIIPDIGILTDFNITDYACGWCDKCTVVDFGHDTLIRKDELAQPVFSIINLRLKTDRNLVGLYKAICNVNILEVHPKKLDISVTKVKAFRNFYIYSFYTGRNFKNIVYMDF